MVQLSWGSRTCLRLPDGSQGRQGQRDLWTIVLLSINPPPLPWSPSFTKEDRDKYTLYALR